MSEQKRPRRMGHGPGHGPGGMMPGEKANNFRGTAKKLLQYMGRYFCDSLHCIWHYRA